MECSKSHVFKTSNPWINALLSICREIYDIQAQQNNSQ
jgi:hypothetical protein